MAEWLVRNSQNWISGPYSKSEIIRMVREGKLRSSDELCEANSYWFNLTEEKTVRELLGIEPLPTGQSSEEDSELDFSPPPKSPEDEVTDPNILIFSEKSGGSAMKPSRPTRSPRAGPSSMTQSSANDPLLNPAFWRIVAAVLIGLLLLVWGILFFWIRS